LGVGRRTLTALFPPPTPVMLGGRAWLVPELTLGEIAEAEAPRGRRRPDPLASVRDLLWLDEVPPSERHRFDTALALAEGEEVEGVEIDLAGLAGEEVVALVRVALRRHHPGVADDDDALGALLGAMTPGEYRALHDAALPPDPMRVLCAALDRFCGTGGGEDDGDGVDWFALVDRVSRSHGMSYAAIREMTVAQFANALCEGKAPDGRAARPGEDYGATYGRWTRWLAGEGSTDGG
jgi:hypothetical protein